MNLKEVVGKKAVEYVKDGMIVGLGTGSTVFYFVHALADRVKEGLNVEMVSTSIQTVEPVPKPTIIPSFTYSTASLPTTSFRFISVPLFIYMLL